VVALVARYGYLGSDAAADGLIAEFFFATIAMGGIAGPAVAVHLFRSATGWARLWGALAGIVAIVALVANLSNSLGALAGRADKTLAKRTKATETRKDDRAELARLMDAMKTLPAYTPATAEDVAAARAAVKAAEDSRKAECESRGKHCRARETAEQEKRADLSKALINKAATDQAAKLGADAAAIRKGLDAAPPVAASIRSQRRLGESWRYRRRRPPRRNRSRWW
jgi:type IV secretory pathway VirB10-like protein